MGGICSNRHSAPICHESIEDAQTVVDLDPKHIYLAGLSNGGLGVSHVALQAPDLFRGLIFSGVPLGYCLDFGSTFFESVRSQP